mgnify:CR=1 FL=1
MKIPISWIKDYIKFDVPANDIADLLTMAGTEVSNIQKIGTDWDKNKLKVGQILNIEKHPNADRLSLVEVLISNSQKINVVCGANNIEVGQKIAFAESGSELYSPRDKKTIVLKKSNIRGIESNGMICSPLELKYSEDHEGILVLDKNEKIGSSLYSVIGDEILDFDITPNRSDCLSVIGITREIIAILNSHKFDYKINEKYLYFNTLNNFQSKKSKNIDVQNLNFEKCLRYSGSEISSIVVENSPFWIKDRLIKSGLRPINNIVDVTNYVMMELGQPLHAFDLSKIKTKKIEVKSSKNKEKFKSLDGENRELNSNILSITDGAQSIGLAGIIGGFNSEIDSKTKNIFLESACFEMSNIRQSSKELGLNTDASHRFERGVPIGLSIIALNRAIALIEDINKKEIIINGNWDLYSKNININPNKKQNLTGQRYKKIIGESITRKETANILNSLGFNASASKTNETNFTQKVEIPYWRSDITIEDDLIEEIARIKGYDNLSSEPLQYPENNIPVDNNIMYRNNIRNEMKSMGYIETINYPTINNTEYNLTNLNVNSPIKLQNPINKKNNILRPNLKTGLINNISINSKKYPEIDSWKFYELGRIFNLGNMDNKYQLPDQSYSLGIISSGLISKTNWNSIPDQINFYTFKGDLDRIIKSMGIKIEFKKNNNYYFYSEKSALLFSENAEIGSIGNINEQTLTKFNVKLKEVLYCELNLDKLENSINYNNEFTKTSPYPLAIRDLSLTVDKNVLSNQISDIIKQNPLVTDLNVIDVYSDLKPEKKSITIRITYQSFNETLNNLKIDESQNKILRQLKKHLNIELRKT